jgi:hypothetical protein
MFKRNEKGAISEVFIYLAREALHIESGAGHLQPSRSQAVASYEAIVPAVTSLTSDWDDTQQSGAMIGAVASIPANHRA